MAKVVSSKDKSVGKTTAKGAKPSGGRVAAARQAAVAKSGRTRVPAKGKAKTAEKKPRGKFLRDVRSEMGKVNWPTRTELIQSTIVVLVAVAVAAAFTFALDTAFSRFVDLIVKVIS